jgi:hypothetical protein
MYLDTSILATSNMVGGSMSVANRYIKYTLHQKLLHTVAKWFFFWVNDMHVFMKPNTGTDGVHDKAKAKHGIIIT